MAVREAIVFIHLPGEIHPTPAGLLQMHEAGRNSFATFQYGARYLERGNRLAIDPVSLPVPENPALEFQTQEGFPLFGAVRDASPDAWGRHILNRASGKLELSEFEYLLGAGNERVGALSFGPDTNGPRRLFDWQEPRAGETLDLQTLLDHAESFENELALPAELVRFIRRGSSLGGARPKATAISADAYWLVKFARKDDAYDMVGAEFATMSLARDCGLRVPEIQLRKVANRRVYLIRRFDRQKTESGWTKNHFVSGLTLLGAHESDRDRWTYIDLVDQLRKFGTHWQEDARELYLRMAFNAFANNTDDHLRNHGFLNAGPGYRLSPLYDVVCFPQVSRDERFLAIGMHRENDPRRISIDNFWIAAPSFGLSVPEAKSLVEKMWRTLLGWRTAFETAGFHEETIRQLEPAFQLVDSTDENTFK